MGADIEGRQIPGYGTGYGSNASMVYGQVHAGQFQGASDAQRVAHGRDGHPGFGEHEGHFRPAGRPSHGNAVTLGRLDGQPDSGERAERGRPGTRREHHLFRRDFSPGRVDNRNAVLFFRKARYCRTRPHFDPLPLQVCRQAAHELARRQMGVLPEVQAAQCVQLQPRQRPGQTVRGKFVDFKPVGGEEVSFLFPFLQALTRSIQGHHTPLMIVEIHSVQIV